MPYSGKTVTGNAACRDEIKSLAMCGVEMPDALAAKVEKIESEYSSFSDPGPDWSRHKLFDGAGALVGDFTVDGY